MAVRIRMRKFGRKHRPFFRLCAIDGRQQRDGRVIEELGHYDPMVPDTDARAILNGERIAYWVSVGAQPSEAARVLIKKYGENGTHLEKQKAALEKLATKSYRPQPMKPIKAKPAPAPAEAPGEVTPAEVAGEGS
ncbi:MAG TPA: 30S ribosomal protein S16 [Pirellulaceae bacterium]|nr:30S ribosomal protein S16 [Pirellulaceae bacterium]